MYIAVSNTNNIVLECDTEIEALGHGHVFFKNRKVEFQGAIAKIVTVESIPEDYAPGKYTYSVDGKWEPYIEPEPPAYDVSEEVVLQIKDECVDEIRKEVQNG